MRRIQVMSRWLGAVLVALCAVDGLVGAVRASGPPRSLIALAAVVAVAFFRRSWGRSSRHAQSVTRAR